MSEIPSTSREPLPIFSTIVRILAFRVTREELLRLDTRHLVAGFACTLIVGAGRYWDDPGAHWAQHLGLGSAVYVGVLSGFLWLLLWPLGPMDWSYRRILTFVALVSPPAILYAIPVERFLTLGQARTANVLFLAVVATWRVALLFFFLSRLARLRWYQVIVASLLPLTLIVVALAGLNLERAVFDIMSGMRADSGTANDAAYEILFLLTMLSTIAFPALMVAYVVLVVIAQVRRRRARPADAEVPQRQHEDTSASNPPGSTEPPAPRS